MDLNAIFAPLTAWIDTHPAFISWSMGWLSAICAGQTVKQMLPGYWTVSAAKRIVQIVASFAGFVTSYLLWPPSSVHASVYAIMCGMSAPTAYTFMKAIIESRWPKLAYNLSWAHVQDRAEDATRRDSTDPTPRA